MRQPVIENYCWPSAIIMLWLTLFLLAAVFFFFRSAIINKVCRLRGSQDGSAQLGLWMQLRVKGKVAGGIISRPSSILAAVTESTQRLLNQFGIYRRKRLLPRTIELHFHPVSQCLMHADVQDRRQVGHKPKNVKINEGFFHLLITHTHAHSNCT